MEELESRVKQRSMELCAGSRAFCQRFVSVQIDLKNLRRADDERLITKKKQMGSSNRASRLAMNGSEAEQRRLVARDLCFEKDP